MNVYTDNHLPAEPWRRDAACLEVPGDLWFPEKGTDSPEAKTICRSCPVVASCLAWALETKPSHGIYAGLSITQLAKLRKEERAA